MLTDADIRAARPREKPQKLFDERGLYLLITSGKKAKSRLWRLKYKFEGREKLLSLGAYPDVSLKRAREKRDELRTQVADGTDPAALRRTERLAQGNTLSTITREWLGKQKHLKESTLKRDRDRLEKYILPSLGNRPVSAITAPDLLAALRRIEDRGTHETAHRTRAVVGRVLRYAIATGRAERDVSADLKGALAPAVGKNHAAITDPQRIGELLRAIDGYVGQPATAAALKLAPLVFVRPGELRAAEWSEFDLDGAEWRIPGERMKMGVQHIVPLSRQAVAILLELQPLTGDGRYVFPALTSPLRPLSENTLNAALRRLGYSGDEMVAHGFRSIASTLLNEQAWHPDLIELQLAHAERNKVRGAYNKAQRLPERRKMLQAWANYLDGLKSGGKVVAIGSRRAG